VQISVRADPAALDTIANFLIERGSPGVVIKKRLVQGYYAQGAGALGISGDVRRFLSGIKAFYPNIDENGVSQRLIKDRNWNRAWQKFFKPQKIGRHFLICPPWLPVPPLRGRRLITIEPGLAFGTGTHATTRGCIEFIERAAESYGAGKFDALDVGTGSGILAMALSKLGAKNVWAIDNDPVALNVAQNNLRANGAARRVRLSGRRLDQIRRSFSLVVANLTAETILDLAVGLARKVAPRGYLVLSGILQQKARDVTRRFADNGSQVSSPTR